MRIVFIGASRFGLRCLETLNGMAGVELAGAVTAPPSFPISYRPQGVTNVLHADVGDYCRRHGIPCETIADGMRDPALLERIAVWRPEAFIVVGWYHMVPKAWRAAAPAYGMHASLLPDYSGGAPLVWAMINGEERTGITLFQLGDGVDDGPILGQAETPISADDTIATLYARIEDLGVELLRRHVPGLAAGTAPLVAQDESKRRIVPQRGPEDGVIDWSLPASRIHDFIRAQTRPYPGAFAMMSGRKVTIWTAQPVAGTGLGPGEIGGSPERPLIGCGNGTGLRICALAVEGEDMTPADWWRLFKAEAAG